MLDLYHTRRRQHRTLEQSGHRLERPEADSGCTSTSAMIPFGLRCRMTLTCSSIARSAPHTALTCISVSHCSELQQHSWPVPHAYQRDLSKLRIA
eukprot:3940110-Rhodomonas_salina.2